MTLDLKAIWSKLISLSWMTHPNFLAQAGHFAIGVIAVSLPVAVAGVRATGPFRWWIYALIGTGLDIAYFIHKETNTDPRYEDEGFWPEGFKDCAFNLLGLLLAWGILWGADNI